MLARVKCAVQQSQEKRHTSLFQNGAMFTSLYYRLLSVASLMESFGDYIQIQIIGRNIYNNIDSR